MTVVSTETANARPLIQKYLKGAKVILDIGCGADKITEEAIGIDMRHETRADLVINPADIYRIHLMNKLPEADVVFSSHCLEHLADWKSALKSWAICLRFEGWLVLYLPDDRYYDNKTNKEHVQVFEYDKFVEEVAHLFEDKMATIEHGTDFENGHYSFWVAIKSSWERLG